MTIRDISYIIESCGIEISPLYMKSPVGLAVKKIDQGITYETIEASMLLFDSEAELMTKCQDLKKQQIVCFKPFVVTEKLIRGAFLTYHEISQTELNELVRDLSQFYTISMPE
jgi:hypothetical protein